MVLFGQNGVSRSSSLDLHSWTFAGSASGGENISVVVSGNKLVLFHSSENGIGVDVPLKKVAKACLASGHIILVYVQRRKE